MKNENAKLVFIYFLLGSVESYTDVTHKVPAKVYFNFPVPDLDIGDQKAVLTELKKKKIIAPKTQKSRQNAEIPVMVSNQPDSVILDTVWGDRGDLKFL